MGVAAERRCGVLCNLEDLLSPESVSWFNFNYTIFLIYFVLVEENKLQQKGQPHKMIFFEGQ
jgi:hypothetical protein